MKNHIASRFKQVMKYNPTKRLNPKRMSSKYTNNEDGVAAIE